MIQISDTPYSEMLTAHDPNLAYPTYLVANDDEPQ